MSKSIQHGLPRFLQSGSLLHFGLIKEWIRLCDEGECTARGGCCLNPDTAALMPTRVIDVGDGRTVRLVLTDKDKIRRVRYAALSHCWGNPTEEQKNWCSTTGNKNE